MGPTLFRVNKVWHYRFQINGARVQRSSKETVKRRAEEIAEREYRRALLWSRGADAMPTVHQAVIQWLAAHQSTASAPYLKGIETLGRLHLYGLADLQLDMVSTRDVEDARIEHLKSHARESANTWLRSLKAVCNWQVRRNVLPSLPWRVTMLKTQKRPRPILPTGLALQWLAAVDEIAGQRRGISIAIRLMFGLGLRESETITARWEWFDWERLTYTPGITKGREADPVPIPRWLAQFLEPYRQPSGLVVVDQNGLPLGRGFSRAPMLQANQRCGTKGLTAHRLRGSFATLLSEQGVPVQTIKRVMRHKDTRTTMVYLESDLGRVVDAQARLASITGLDTVEK